MNSIEFYISCHIFKEVLECVQYLHDLKPPVIHKDLHSGNILLARNVRNGRFFKVADFGSATIRKSISNVSNPTHEAPEVRRGESNDPKSDVYSLAITTEEIFSFDLEDTLESSSQKYSSNNEVLNKCVFHLKQTCGLRISYYSTDDTHHYFVAIGAVCLVITLDNTNEHLLHLIFFGGLSLHTSEECFRQLVIRCRHLDVIKCSKSWDLMVGSTVMIAFCSEETIRGKRVTTCEISNPILNIY
ncbi:unnamed protein product [Oppiella nova]|uniref:Protein kinase domain-containing protein n=1 Tax=Oppiella nova TaxID=334625 RepID=A0A7R9LJ31_9ACAR|nr:unnamed protein product [Oppiella nova]CAG2164105.1 unnamed protein product [Oppiella nova]